MQRHGGNEYFCLQQAAPSSSAGSAVFFSRQRGLRSRHPAHLLAVPFSESTARRQEVGCGGQAVLRQQEAGGRRQLPSSKSTRSVKLSHFCNSVLHFFISSEKARKASKKTVKHTALCVEGLEAQFPKRASAVIL
jgi:hypothetical protein